MPREHKWIEIYAATDKLPARIEQRTSPLPPSLDQMQRVVNGYIERIVVGRNRKVAYRTIDIWVNEEGLLIEGLRPSLHIPAPLYGDGYTVMGNCMICAGDDREGDSVGLMDEEINAIMFAPGTLQRKKLDTGEIEHHRVHVIGVDGRVLHTRNDEAFHGS